VLRESSTRFNGRCGSRGAVSNRLETAEIDAAILAADLPNHPEIFIEQFLGTELWHRQREIVRSVWEHKQTFVPTGQSVGKTYLAGRLALAFLYTQALNGERTRVIVVGAKFDQLKMQTWNEVRTAYHDSRWPLGGELRARDLLLSKERQDSYIAIFGTDKDNPERIQGFHAPNLLIISEESSILDDKIAEALEACATQENNHMLFIGNPIRLSGFFYDRCTDPNLDELKAKGLRNVIRISTLEAPAHVADPDWVEAKRIDWGEDGPIWQSRILGQFPQAAEDAVIPFEAVEAACAEERLNYVRPDPDDRAWAMDIARGGDDSALVRLDGDYLADVRARKTPNTEDAVDMCVEAWKDWQGKGAIDENGLGGNPYDRLRNKHIPIRGWVSQRKARNSERFANLKAEMLWSLRERFIEGMIAIPKSRYTERLKADLTGYRWQYDNKGRTQIIDPSRSPDFGDALLMAHWRQRGPGIEGHFALKVGHETLTSQFPKEF
jgi:phage terminase large subunit